ncbi:MAG: hypothetical protein Q8N71_00370 [candidate division Zixibacteria bacterium]|nr:hypothetical protein [candidate division Zixibacteria bacterium]
MKTSLLPFWDKCVEQYIYNSKIEKVKINILKKYGVYPAYGGMHTSVGCTP